MLSFSSTYIRSSKSREGFIIRSSVFLVLNFDLHEWRDLSPADGALIGLHAHDLTALDAETHVPAWQHDCVLSGRVTNHTLSLCFISDVCCVVVNSVQVIQIKYRVVVL